MNSVSPTAAAASREPLAGLLRSALVLDLEVTQQGRIQEVGAVLGDRTFAGAGSSAVRRTLDELAQLADTARCIVGHNLVRHDLRILREQQPEHPLLRRPIIDTLLLSPLAFPENPYHRLVKDYKLVRESMSDPVADARQAALLFGDEFAALDGLRQKEPRVFDLLHFLLATSDEERPIPAMVLPEKPETLAGRSAEAWLASGMELFFQALGGSKPSQAHAMELCRALFAEHGCRSLPVDVTLVQTTGGRLAVAYTVTWLRIAGSNSVLPPWVRLEYPLVGELVRRLREVPCTAEDCAYCRRVHNPRQQLHAFFGLNDFRPLPKAPDGGSLQQRIIEAGMRDESLLAILPTGGGKSLCYQLPGLVRNYRRGALTVIISPLQALMKDQVDGLVRRTSTPFAAALYGLLTGPERGEVLRRIRLGDVALLYVSPEQLRNRSFGDAIAQREIGCWVFDEAHCLSKWGHDFRPDYLYAGRFIREFAKDRDCAVPAIACFTATAKQDVKDEILAFFKTETGRELARFEGGVERENLRFEVQTITSLSKLERMHDLLSDRLPNSQSGSAIIFRATRAATRETAEYLQAKGWRAAHFHAGLTAPEKKRIQDAFLGGETQVICATNAFGMGIDKEDVRLVLHADTPGSLENYLQEAGRAGRDGRTAECVLLFDEEDCERQFQMEAFSELSRRDIAQILRTLRKATRGNQHEVVITPGEILRDEEIETDINAADRSADTKVRTAIAWLERANFIQRDENVTRFFQARPLVRDLEEARRKMGDLNLPAPEQALWLAILRELMNAGPTESLTVDQLALLPELAAYASRSLDRTSRRSRDREPPPPGEDTHSQFVSAKILKVLSSMVQAGLMKRDTLLNAFVRHKVADHSRVRLERVLEADRRLLDLLSLEEPDPEGWLLLSLRLLNQRLANEGAPTSMELVRKLLKSLSEDGQGFGNSRGSLELRHYGRESYRVKVNRPWNAIRELADKRRRVAVVALETMLGKIPADTHSSAELLVAFSLEELQQEVERDLWLRSEIKDMQAVLERALMYLHEQEIIVLQQGLAVFRAAMTISLVPESKGEKYSANHYQPLQHHYRERIFQVHVMGEYARRGLEQIQEALRLVLAYFNLEKEEFIRRFLGTKPELLAHATTAKSFQRIVTDLANPAQIKIVTAPAQSNMLILAGPGSGKTRTVVHRCAYLLRVERVRPQSILVCCFNRQAALELRRRLRDLVGPDARGVSVSTYHGLALRLLGHSATAVSGPQQKPFNLDALIPEAVAMLRGENVPAGLPADEVRDRLLAGFQFILVDEYQDIDEPQYELISALAGRTLDDADSKLSILAVGDDDQNIYGFRGANVEFIRRFGQDYQAQVHHLVENYRSTAHIITAANALISANSDLMKTGHPIRIDRARKLLPRGGAFGQRDAATQGKVQVMAVPDEPTQAQAVLTEIQRLRQLGVADWQQIAVLSRTHRDLAQVRRLAEAAGIPVRWWAERSKMPPLHQIREIQRFLARLADHRNELAHAPDLATLAGIAATAESRNPWRQFLNRLLEGWQNESDNAELPVQEAVEFFYECCAESRRDFSYGEGITLSTIHAAKGTEYDHVLLMGEWRMPPEEAKSEELRRTFYVGMTRARQTLTVFDRTDIRPSLPQSLSGSAVILREAASLASAELLPALDYTVLSLEDIHLGYPAYFKPGHLIHSALRRLEPGDRLELRPVPRGLGLFDGHGICVACLSHTAEAAWHARLHEVREVRVLALVHRAAASDEDPARRQRYLVSEWEVPVVEIVSETDHRRSLM